MPFLRRGVNIWRLWAILTKLLVHGARSAVYRAANKTDSRSQWINQLVKRSGVNKASVAVANKNIRIAWSMLNNETYYSSNI